MATIHLIHNEAARGCGKRKPGGLYLVADGLSAGCGRLPVPLTVCRCCGQGIKHTRGWTWMSPRSLFGEEEDYQCGTGNCSRCPLSNPPEKAGLLWVGREFYKSPQVFSLEAMAQGVSRRIKAIPRGFELGITWVYLAHVEACTDADGKHIPGIFQSFRPSRIEYIVRGDESEAELDSLESRGATLVKLVRDFEPVEIAQQELLLDAA